MRIFLSSFFFVGLTYSAVAARPEDVIALCKKIYREDATPEHTHPCPCPDDFNQKYGRACGDFSAYRREGGAKPFCFSQDVTQGDLDAMAQGRGDQAFHDRCQYPRRHGS